MNYCPIDFPEKMDVGIGNVFVKIEIYPTGQRHPKAYALLARDDGPARRLRFRIRFTDSMGSEIQYYEKNPYESPLFKANSFVELLADRISYYTTAATER